MAGRTVAGAALYFSRWIVDRMELATGSLAGAGRPPVTASSFYGKGVGAASRVLARQASGQVSWAVHADGALERGDLGGVLARRQAHRQRVLGQYREGLGFSDRQGGECPTLSSPNRLLLRALMLTSVFGP